MMISHKKDELTIGQDLRGTPIDPIVFAEEDDNVEGDMSAVPLP